MRLSGLRFRWIYLLVIVTLAFVSKGDVPQQRVQLVQELAAGRITSYELQFTFTQSGSTSIEDEILEFLGKPREEGAKGAAASATSPAESYHLKRQGDRFWVRRLTATGPEHSDIMGPHITVLGWESNALWSVRNTWVMLDYDKGMQMATPPEVLRDLHSVDAAEFVYPATIAAQLGVPAFSGHVEWSGAEFRVNGGNRARETITGRLVQNKDGSIRLDMDRRSTDINDPAVVRTVVILDYQDNEAVSPCRLLIRDEISLLPGKAPEVWTKELTDFSMSFTPTWGGVGDSPAWYVANPPDAMTMVVISNGSAHTVIRAGKVLAVPERFEPFASSGKQHNVWAVFVVIVVILFAPAWMWIRRKSTAS